MIRILLLIPAVTLLIGASASGATFDGTYAGVVQPTPGMSSAPCGESAPLTFTVKSGSFSAASPRVSGFVNIKGFITGKIQIADRNLPIQGRVEEMEGDGVHFTAGAIDAAANCAWTIDLAKQ